jgi:ankyrin repeat protein
MSITDDLLFGFETHSPARIRKALEDGLDPVAPIAGKMPIVQLMEMYTRSSRFAECLRVMMDAGASLDDPLLEAVLLDDPGRVSNIEKRFYLECAYTSLKGVSALHVCAEYNSVKCARVLLEAGLDVNDRADVDEDGMGGQTPLFHCVNSNGNYCRPVMELLVEAGANLDVRLKGLVWGGGFEWETQVFDVTPISYAQCGLYSQFHRRYEDVYSNVAYLYRHRYGSELRIRNVPNKYL